MAKTETTTNMTAETAAKMVRRSKTYFEDGTKDGQAVKIEKTKNVVVDASEVLAFADYGSHVVVVTKDGQKLSSADQA